MITRIHIKGFKSLYDVELHFDAFTCFVGANASGKSNFFDALTFLSLCADKTLVEAAKSIRSEEKKHSNLKDLFFRYGENEILRTMSFEVDILIPKTGTDDLGQDAEAGITSLRYFLSTCQTFLDNYNSSTSPKAHINSTFYSGNSSTLLASNSVTIDGLTINRNLSISTPGSVVINNTTFLNGNGVNIRYGTSFSISANTVLNNNSFILKLNYPNPTCGNFTFAPDPISVFALQVKVDTVQISKDEFIKVFPNPTTGITNLELSGFNQSNNDLVNLSVINSSGKIVLNKSLDTSKVTAKIDLENQASGLYILSIIYDGKTFNKKIIRE